VSPQAEDLHRPGCSLVPLPDGGGGGDLLLLLNAVGGDAGRPGIGVDTAEVAHHTSGRQILLLGGPGGSMLMVLEQWMQVTLV
jgi:hypothetical protein